MQRVRHFPPEVPETRRGGSSARQAIQRRSVPPPTARENVPAAHCLGLLGATIPWVPYHVRITPSGHSRLSGDELALDLTHDQLEGRFLEPRRTGQPLSLNGRTLRWEEIDRVRINETEEESAQLLPMIRTERATGSVATLIPDEWYVTKQGRDVTDEFITAPPGGEVTQPATPSAYFHVHLRKNLFRDTSVFNLSEADTREQFVVPWLENRGVLIEGRSWSPAGCKLTIYEGPRLSTQQRSFGQGWLNAVKYGEDVTAAMLSSPVAKAPDRATAAGGRVNEARGKWTLPTLWGHLRRIPSWLATAADAVTVVGAVAGVGKLLGVW